MLHEVKKLHEQRAKASLIWEHKIPVQGTLTTLQPRRCDNYKLARLKQRSWGQRFPGEKKGSGRCRWVDSPRPRTYEGSRSKGRGLLLDQHLAAPVHPPTEKVFSLLLLLLRANNQLPTWFEEIALLVAVACLPPPSGEFVASEKEKY